MNKATKPSHNDLLSKTASPLKISSIILSKKSINTMKSWKWLLEILIMSLKINNSSLNFILSTSSIPLMKWTNKKKLYFLPTPKWAKLSQTSKKPTKPSKTKSKDGQSNFPKQPFFLKPFFLKTKFSEKPFARKINNFWNSLRPSQTLKISKLLKSKKIYKSWENKMEYYSIICKEWKNSKNKNVKTEKD